MSKKSRKFIRETGFREQIPVILVATEGDKTEPQYFEILKSANKVLNIQIVPSKGKSSPNGVLKNIKKEIKKHEIGKRDKAWLVVDIDEWPTIELDAVYEWSLLKANYRLAVSNPKFEYWLLLHFDPGNNIKNKKECVKRLLHHIPSFKKGDIDKDKFTIDRIKDAINNAKKKDTPACEKWPEDIGTTVYKLVEILLT
jgi:hypothetical protein